MNVFIYWEGPIPIYVQKCIDKMTRIFKNKLIIINEKNIRNYVHKLPNNLKKINKIAVQVDYIRIALLYYNSGIYLDADCIVFPNFLQYLEEIWKKYQNKDLIGLGKNNIIDANAFLISPQKNSFVLRKILEKQEEIIERKKGLLFWSEIGGNLIKEITQNYADKCITLNPNPLVFFGWKNTGIFATKNKELILEKLEQLFSKKCKGIMLYNQVMKNTYFKNVPEDCFLGYLLKN